MVYDRGRLPIPTIDMRRLVKRDIERKRTVKGGAPELPVEGAPTSAAEENGAEPLLDSAARILTASGASPALLHEVLELQANVLGGEVSEDMVILLLEAAVNHHLPDIQEDQRAWAKELVRIAGI